MMGSMKTYSPSWLKDLVRPFRKQAVVALALGVASACCGALLMFVSGYLICRTAWPGTTLFMVMVPVAFVQLFGIGRPITHYFERLVSHDWVFRITSSLRKRLMQAALAIADDPANPKSSGDYLEMLADDIGHLQNLYLRVGFPALIAIVLLVFACVFCAVFDLSIAGAVLMLGIVATLVMPAISYAVTKALQLRIKSMKAESYDRITDDVMGALDWSLAGRAPEAVAINEASGSSLLSAEVSLRGRIRIVELVSALFLGLGVVLVTCLAANAFQGSAGGEHYIAAFALGLFPLMQMFILLPGAVSDAPTHVSSIRNLDEVLSFDMTRKSGTTPEALPHSACSIELDDISYRYPATPIETLMGINLSIPRGQKVAVIGQSGSGKTTLAALIRGALAPSKGSISIECITMPNAADLVCYIPQTPYVFDASLRDNLSFASSQASDGEMLEALVDVGLGEKIRSLESGLDTHVGETGIGFSGGESHRIALARALLSQRPIVLLDEPFSAVDPATERMLLDTLFEAFEGKTLVVVTHHLMDIDRFDRVMLMSNGAIQLDGSPAMLSNTSSHFRELLEFDRS